MAKTNKETNQIIVDAFLEKNERVMAHFYQTQWPITLRILKTAGCSESEAKDIMQRSFITLYDKIRNGKYENRQEASISTYFQKICRFSMLNHRRAAHKSRTSYIDILEIELPNHGKNDNFEFFDSENESRCQKLLNEIGEKCRKILIAFYWDNRSIEEIATMQQLTYESAKNAKYRCLARMKKMMTNNNV